MANTVDKVIAIAKSQVGYLEKSKEAVKANPQCLYNFTDGAGEDNYTKYGKEMHDIYPSVMDYPAAWCDCFVDWCFYQAYGKANAKGLLGGDFNDYTPASAQLYKNKKAYYKHPQVGDQIFFNNGTRICHTGIVVAVDDDAKTVTTIEGNTSGANTLVANGGGVRQKTYPQSYERIDGYGRPKYDKPQEGWVEENGTWYFYYGGFKVKKSWIDSNGYRYRLGNNGEMLTDWHQIYDDNANLKWYYFDSKGRLWHDSGAGDGSMERWHIS